MNRRISTLPPAQSQDLPRSEFRLQAVRAALFQEFERLRRIRAELTALRKGDHHAQWLRIESGKLHLHWKKYRDATADRRREMEAAKHPQARAITKEAWEELERDLKLM